METVLITGGSGFIGINLARIFVNKGYKVVIFDVAQPDEKLTSKEVVFARGNVSYWTEVCNFISREKVDHVFHLAALLSAQCAANPWAGFQVNIEGTYNLLEAARLFNVRKFIYSSSMSTYYGAVPGGVATEETPQRPQGLYGISKVFGELMGSYYWRQFGTDFRAIKFPQIVGPGVKSEGFGQYTAGMINAAISNRPFEVPVDEETSIPIMYVKDAIRSLVELFEADENSIQTRVYNVGQILPPVTAGGLSTEIKKHFPSASISFRPDPLATESNRKTPRILDGTNAQREWGWSVQYDLNRMLEDYKNETMCW